MSQATRILLSLLLGLIAGIATAALAPGAVEPTAAIAEPIGNAWLAGLQMTVIPLVTALLITGVAQTAEAASAGKVAARGIALFITGVFVTGAIAALVTPLILDLFPVPADAAAALRGALTGVAPVEPPPPLSKFFATLVPTNVVAAAASNALLSLIVFTLAFAFAITRLSAESRDLLVRFFAAIRDASLILVEWVLKLAPIGVFALAYVVGARAGAAALGAFVHYILVVAAIGVVVILLAYVLAGIGAGMSPLRFGRVILPAQAVAASTQSSLATLPAMIEAARALGIRTEVSGVTLPIGVAMFRATQPAMNVAIAVYIAYWFNVPIQPANLAAAVAVAALVSLGSVSLPAQLTFFASVAPPCVALGVPLAPLGLLIAVETIPDIFRTLGNVSMNLAATATLARHSDGIEPTLLETPS
ncbi:MAG: cation:dicarboxylase symporter family transporter [Sphingomonas bacterium]|uniref:dicarboxylate/amino acid:cation symporter n=1 Tax=Sphingomonas bacterium TaxID=1895847 RepID=UPI0026345A8B|nr:cation:dicarboxylase symporter family transporter [Sphingomonas bacterium]MDB5696316.1 cation:dicarboxylase symporter family transporter [Sphingomonas bacterium]